jgi:hypothetical protein
MIWHSCLKKIKTTPLRNHRLLTELACDEKRTWTKKEPGRRPGLPERRQNYKLLLLLLGVPMSRLEPLLLQEEEDIHKNGSEDGEAGLENRKKKILHAAFCYVADEVY